LGYETDSSLLVFAGLACSSVTYLLFFAGVCQCLLVPYRKLHPARFEALLLPSASTKPPHRNRSLTERSRESL